MEGNGDGRKTFLVSINEKGVQREGPVHKATKRRGGREGRKGGIKKQHHQEQRDQ